MPPVRQERLTNTFPQVLLTLLGIIQASRWRRRGVMRVFWQTGLVTCISFVGILLIGAVVTCVEGSPGWISFGVMLTTSLVMLGQCYAVYRDWRITTRKSDE